MDGLAKRQLSAFRRARGRGSERWRDLDQHRLTCAADWPSLRAGWPSDRRHSGAHTGGLGSDGRGYTQFGVGTASSAALLLGTSGHVTKEVCEAVGMSAPRTFEGTIRRDLFGGAVIPKVPTARVQKDALPPPPSSIHPSTQQTSAARRALSGLI
ncbi:hypothetical protein DFJ74DRAFT_695263 [Hyaloraphidium curvatum]|nr:hypothetical protein DFJ74DRAFT_695263 [Hyaloraphidium curvatum]